MRALEQDGVVSRQQLAALGARPHDVRRMLRRRELTVVHRGVYVDHTGPLTRRQQEWAAVLTCWPGALSHRSALPGPQSGPVHVAVGDRRSLEAPHGVVVHRMASFDERVHPTSSPPRIRLEHAAIDAVSELPDPTDAFALLAEVVGTRQTTAGRIATVLRGRRGVPKRRLLLELLDDLEAGACSVLEREYLRLERSHGLPAGTRQRRDRVDSASIYRDVEYAEYGVVVELDGRASHDGVVARDRDARRDLVTLVSGRPTVRLTHGLVLRDGCRSIATVGELLASHGWPGPARACPACPGESTRADKPQWQPRAPW